uniref:Convicilin storage protein 2 n=1 Tax=Lotus japonicus TaxID=34305 RepID=B5U8K4_LOTJA|nr:convicilin storage protein 2 [Lotus japonicus]
MASTEMKARFPLLLLLGILFLASVSVCYGIVSHDKEDDDRRPWWPEPEREEEKHHQRTRGSEEGEKEERERHQEPGHRERARQEGEKEEDERQPWWQPGRGEEEGEWRGSRRLEDPDERERVRERTERAKKWRRETEERDTPRRPHHRESEEEEGSSSSSSSESSRRSQRRNPFYFRSSSSRFQTRFQNEYGYVRVLQRFDERSKLFENLQNYRIFEFKAKPHTVVLPHHNDADSIVVILSGKAIITLVNPNDRESFNLERGDVLVHPAGTIAYVANHDDNENLRIAKIIIPVNRPGEFQAFYPSNTEPQESYLNGFSRNILEASFNAEYNEIERVLLRGGEQRQEQGLIVKVSRDLIQQLSRHAKSSSRKRTSSEPEPFNLRSRDPIYSNEFGKHFEINPNRNSQLRDFDIFLSSTEIRESIFLPHYNSRSTVILVVNEGRGEFELVAQRKQQQQRRNEEDEEEEEEQPRIEAQRFRARLSPGDVVVIPAGHPVAINASSDLNFIAFGINAENNQRHFLAGGDDNVISQIEKVVKEIAFPGSAEDIERLIKNQRNSHFANAQPQQREEGGHGRRGPLSSILGAFTK